MLARGPQILLDAGAQGRAVPAFTTYTLESTRAICEAAERTGLPVILSAGSSSFRGSSRAMLAAAAVAAAREASVPVGVHLDHSTDLDEIRACLDLGYTSVMFDGSHLPFDENVALTRAVVAEAHAAGVWVEAELGGVAGNENASTDAAACQLTEPERARSSSSARASTRSPQRSGPCTASPARPYGLTSTVCARSLRAPASRSCSMAHRASPMQSSWRPSPPA